MAFPLPEPEEETFVADPADVQAFYEMLCKNHFDDVLTEETVEQVYQTIRYNPALTQVMVRRLSDGACGWLTVHYFHGFGNFFYGFRTTIHPVGV